MRRPIGCGAMWSPWNRVTLRKPTSISSTGHGRFGHRSPGRPVVRLPASDPNPSSMPRWKPQPCRRRLDRAAPASSRGKGFHSGQWRPPGGAASGASCGRRRSLHPVRHPLRPALSSFVVATCISLPARLAVWLSACLVMLRWRPVAAAIVAHLVAVESALHQVAAAPAPTGGCTGAGSHPAAHPVRVISRRTMDASMPARRAGNRGPPSRARTASPPMARANGS